MNPNPHIDILGNNTRQYIIYNNFKFLFEFVRNICFLKIIFSLYLECVRRFIPRRESARAEPVWGPFDYLMFN